MLERIRKLEQLLEDILPGAMAASCEYNDHPKADLTFHCCDWNEIVQRIRDVLHKEG